MKADANLKGLIRSIRRAESREKAADHRLQAVHEQLRAARDRYVRAVSSRVIQLLSKQTWKVADYDRDRVITRLSSHGELSALLTPVARSGWLKLSDKSGLQLRVSCDFAGFRTISIYRGTALENEWWAPRASVQWQEIHRLIVGGALDSPEGVKKLRKIAASAQAKKS